MNIIDKFFDNLDLRLKYLQFTFGYIAGFFSCFIILILI